MLAQDSTYGPRERDSIRLGREDYVDVEDENRTVVRGGFSFSTLIVVDNGRTLVLS